MRRQDLPSPGLMVGGVRLHALLLQSISELQIAASKNPAGVAAGATALSTMLTTALALANALSEGTALPANAVTLQGIEITLGGEIITLGA